ncbi:hypothetical protein B7463_g6935, partial [Scytalidium lignicola]
MGDYNPESIKKLFRAVQNVVPPSFPKDSWYLIVATMLASISRGNAVGELFQYVTADSSVDYKRKVSQRLREMILKSWTLIGMPRAISASYALQAADKDGDSAVEHQRVDVVLQPDLVMRRSKDWFAKTFQEDEQAIFDRFSAHKEMEWALRYVVYGLFLADLSVISPIENEFIVLASVMSVGGSPTLSHFKALRRLVISAPDAEAFQNICEMVAQWAGHDTSAWPRAKEVEKYFPANL